MEKLEEIHQIKSERLVVDDPNASLVDAMTDYKRREGLVFANSNTHIAALVGDGGGCDFEHYWSPCR